MSLHKKGHIVDIVPYSELGCLPYLFAEKLSCDMHLYSTKSHYVNMQDWLLQIMQLIQYPHVSLFSTVITNNFIGEGFYLSQHSMDGYEAMGFYVTQSTQDVEQSLFTIKTNMSIPMLVYMEAFQ